MDDMKLIVQRKTVKNTADGGSDITFETDESQSVQSAKIFLIPKDTLIELTVRVKPDG